jgi:hypothetical protein
MGNAESSSDNSTPKINAKDKAQLKEKVVSTRIESINNVQKDSIQTITTHEDLVKTILFTETAKEQLKKGGSALTKTDIIAIIIMIDLNKMNNLEYLKTLTVNDLNTIIRSIIYDTNRYTNKSSNFLITNNSNNNNNNNETSKQTSVKSNTGSSKSSKKLEIMDVEPTQFALIEDKPVKKSSVKKTKEDKEKNNMALVISK